MLVKYLRALLSCFVTRGASSGEQTIYGKRLSEVGVGDLDGGFRQDVDMTPQAEGLHELVAPFDCVVTVTRTSSYDNNPEAHLGIARKKGYVVLMRSNYNICVCHRLKKGESYSVGWSGEGVFVDYYPT